MTRVLVTGASGFLAGHCIADLRTHGYTVRGTVRDPHTADVGHLDGIQLCKATLDADDGWREAVDGCDYVLHVASPFPATIPRDENEVIRPAVDGTLRVLRAAKAAGVRRVVLTSSVAAVSYGHPEGTLLTEQDWSDTAVTDAYPKSKTLAERSAWEFARDTGLELVTILPGSIFGPVLHGNERTTSLEAIRQLLAGEIPAVPRIGWSTVDVRDLATAHRLAMETPGAAGKRYICAGPHAWLGDIAGILAERHRVVTRRLPYWLMWVLGRFDPTIRLGLTFYGRSQHVSASRAVGELGWSMRPLRETLHDAAESMIRHGVVAAR
ncbi:SDR family oxidoreductase [Catenuloplanes japonicus]|uniref:SDR family oxidoreductase n=1 Tax=Catenuloplanes japonicus TaxID=33876 RepID=UPI000526B60D|nr:aldehyde reductase [Catenuloplanes japonicus]